MKNKSLLFSICLLLFLSCKQRERDNKHNSSPHPVQKIVRKVSDTNPIIGVLDISKDSIVVVTSSGLFFTEDQGKTWKDISNGCPSNELTIDNKNRLWINLSGGGLHEPKVALFFTSTDFGKSWNTVQFDPEQFFPYKFISKPHEALKVLTKNGSVYQLSGADLKKDWKLKDSINIELFDRGMIAPYFVDTQNPGQMKLYCANQTIDTIARLDSLYSFTNLIKLKDTIYVAGSGALKDGMFEKAFLFTIGLKHKTVYSQTLPDAYAVVKSGSDNRIWVYTSKHLYLKKGRALVLYY